MAQWEGFEFEKAIFYGVNSCHFRLSAPFLRYIASFCTLPHIRLKGENKGEKSGHLPPPAAGVAEIRRTSSGAAAPCGRPGGLLQLPGVTEGQTHARRCCRALWAAWRPPSAARGGGGQAHVRRHCCALWAAWRPPSAAGGDGGQTHTRLRCRVLGVPKATFCARAAPRRREASGLSWTPASSGKAGTRCFSKGGRQGDTPAQLAVLRCRVVELCPNRTRSKPGQQKGTHDKNTRRYTLADCGHNSSHDSTSSASGSSRPSGFDILHVSLWPTSWQALPPCFSVSLSKVISYYK